MPVPLPPSTGEDAAQANADPTLRTRRARELAVILPLLGVFLLVSPVIRVFAAPGTVAGIPLIVLYIFGVWAVMIVATAALTRRFLRQAPRR
ncbi:MAG: hypothetical protein AAGE13_15675 [Pseudomonadota bacterium]